MSTRLIINGAAGRMGRRLLALGSVMDGAEIVQAIDYAAHPLQGKPLRELDPTIASPLCLTSEYTADADVLIDFSTPETTVVRASEAAKRKCALIIGTTGLTPAQEEVIAEVSRTVPVIHAANYSFGVNIMLKFAAEMAAALGEEYNIEILETHHNRKVDAPSGTALEIAKGICAATGRIYPDDLVNGRSGRPGARTKKEIGMHALRMGSVVGEHTVCFGNDFERLQISHHAESRDVLVNGALRAALWIAGKPAGRYTMRDVISG